MGNFRRNLQRKHTENYNSFTLMEFRVHCKNLFEIQMHERRGVMVLFQNASLESLIYGLRCIHRS